MSEEIQGKIQWLPNAPTEYPQGSGKYNIGLKIENKFYNKHDDVPKLEEYLKALKVGFEVRLQVVENIIQELEIVSDKVEAPAEVDNSNIVDIKGKKFMTYEGLLAKAHEKDENFAMEITESWISEDMKKAWCKVRLIAKGRIFDGIGSSTPENTGQMTQEHPVEMANTRAKGRALRDYLNIGQVMAEELKQ